MSRWLYNLTSPRMNRLQIAKLLKLCYTIALKPSLKMSVNTEIIILRHAEITVKHEWSHYLLHFNLCLWKLVDYLCLTRKLLPKNVCNWLTNHDLPVQLQFKWQKWICARTHAKSCPSCAAQPRCITRTIILCVP